MVAHQGSGVTTLTSTRLHVGHGYYRTGLVAGSSGPPVAGYVAWYDAQAITATADGTALASWADSSGNGHDLAQGTGANRPTYYKTTSANLINGHPSVFCSSVNGTLFMDAGVAITQAQPWTVVAVAAYSDATHAGVLWGASAQACIAEYLDTTSGIWTVCANSCANTNNFAGGSSAHFTAFCANGASSYFRQDSTKQTGLSLSTTGLATNFRVGNNVSAATGGWRGAIGEILVYGAALSDTQLNSLHSYAVTKWGVS